MELGKKLTRGARDALAVAEILARSSGAEYIGTEYLLLGILNQSQSESAHILLESGVTFDKLREKLKISEPSKAFEVLAFSPTKGFSETVRLSLRMSIELADKLGHDFCSTEHILFSLLSQHDSRAVSVLHEINVDIEPIIHEISNLFNESEDNKKENLAVKPGDRQTKGSFLNKFSRNLTLAAKNNELDPVIGREKEIERAVAILSRRRKNNPVLIGEAGVGKTAIVEGLAQKIISSDVPSNLLNKKILQVDLTGLLAGTKFRGEFEDRIQKLINEAKQNKDIILFIDELHLLNGAGAGEGSMDAANILKPSLSRGEMRLIGATTNDEYRKNIEKDAALARRFQPIKVNQPNFLDTILIINGVREKYEKHHKVKIGDKVIEAAVRLSDRYLTERFQPDKALDVIDEACALARINNEKGKNKANLKNDFAKLKSEKKLLSEKIEAAEFIEDYEKAALYKMRLSRVDEQLDDIKAEKHVDSLIKIKESDIESAVAQMTGIPVEQLSRNEVKRMLLLEKSLSKKIIGQSAALHEISRSVKRNAVGISNEKQPIGSFIFLGPTGVGKTETARVLAKEVFGGEKNLIKIDMSEFSEAHSSARLIGAPAGYVGYDDGGNLTEKIRRNPYSVVLFDEIEKAHPKIFNLLLQILEDSSLTDGRGRKIDFSNTIIILTSNIGVPEVAREKLGFGNNSVKGRNKNQQSDVETAKVTKKFDEINSGLRKIMQPELLNRFDAIVEFSHLNKEELEQIFDLKINDLNNRLNNKGIQISIAKSAKNWLLKTAQDTKFGARPLRRIIQSEIEDPLTDALLKRDFIKGDLIKMSRKNNKIVFEKNREMNSEKVFAKNVKSGNIEK